MDAYRLTLPPDLLNASGTPHGLPNGQLESLQPSPLHASPHTTGSSFLLDLPLDIVIHLLASHCPPPLLAILSRTCKTLNQYCIPILYRALDLSYTHLKAPDLDPWRASAAENRQLAWAMQFEAAIPQRAAMGYLLRNPAIAKSVKSFKFTLGCSEGEEAVWELWEVMKLLENVEDVTIDQHPMAHCYYLAVEEGLAGCVFPNARHVQLDGFDMACYRAEAQGWKTEEWNEYEYDRESCFAVVRGLDERGALKGGPTD